MSWLKLARKANDYAEAKAQQAFNEHADPKVQVEQAITALQQHQQELEEAASHVLAQEKMAKMRLSELSAKEAKLTANAQAAMSSGHQDAARTFALQLSATREQIQALTGQIPQLEAAANDARTAVQEGADLLQQKLNERNTILAQIDQAHMQQEMAASLKQVSDLTSSGDVPSFDEIKNKVQGQFAQAQAATELHANDPAVLEMQAHHDQLNSEADAILAQLSAGSLKPAALEAPAAASKTATT
ncbi:MAG TPA: PspA/IM30 family protein [Acidimicrobiales bacterium]|nr:PspA/IM30 family protein [Acidimicrobiales bacterium]